MPTTVFYILDDEEASITMMIGVDPHKGSHTAVAVDAGERSLGELRVRPQAARAAGHPPEAWRHRL